MNNRRYEWRLVTFGYIECLVEQRTIGRLEYVITAPVGWEVYLSGAGLVASGMVLDQAKDALISAYEAASR